MFDFDIELLTEIEPLVEAIRAYTGTKVRVIPNFLNFTIKCPLFDTYCRYNKPLLNTFVRASLSIVPRHQRKGHGRAITEIMIDFARQKGFDRFMIENALTEGGIGLAKACGFSSSKMPMCWELELNGR